MPADWTSTISFARIERAIIAAAERGGRAAAEHVKADSLKVVPTDPGDELAHSARTSAETTGSVTTAAVSYDTPYAVVQHERLDFHHDGGRQAKYLETPLLADAHEVASIVADHVRDALR